MLLLAGIMTFAMIPLYIAGAVSRHKFLLRKENADVRKSYFVLTNIAAFLCFMVVGSWRNLLDHELYTTFQSISLGLALAGAVMILVGAGKRAENILDYRKMWNIGFAFIGIHAVVYIEPLLCAIANSDRISRALVFTCSACSLIVAIPLFIIGAKRRKKHMR